MRAWKQRAAMPAGRQYNLYDGALLLAEINPNGSLQLSTYGPNGVVAVNFSGGDIIAPSVTGYGFDPCGNLAATIRPSDISQPVAPCVSDAFGQDQGAGLSDCFGFAGQWGAYTDNEGYGAWSSGQRNSRMSTTEALTYNGGYGTGLILMGYRYYDPNTGRFLTRDPIGYAGGINLYAYCGNNPVNFMDPLGLSPTDGWGTDADPLIRTMTDDVEDWMDRAKTAAPLAHEAINDLYSFLDAAGGMAVGALGNAAGGTGGRGGGFGRGGGKGGDGGAAGAADDAAGLVDDAVNAAEGLPDFSGRGLGNVLERLNDAGFAERPRAPGSTSPYREFRHPDGSKVWIDTAHQHVKVLGPHYPGKKYGPRYGPHNQPYEE